MYVLLTLSALAWIKVYNALKLALKLSPFSAFPTLGFESLVAPLQCDSTRRKICVCYLRQISRIYILYNAMG